MDLLKMLRDEERRLASRLTGLRAAIQALSGNSSKPNAGEEGAGESSVKRMFGGAGGNRTAKPD